MNNTKVRPSAAAPAPMLSPAELAARWGVTVELLNRWRHLGTGPKYQKLTERTVRYALGDIQAYEERSTVATAAK